MTDDEFKALRDELAKADRRSADAERLDLALNQSMIDRETREAILQYVESQTNRTDPSIVFDTNGREVDIYSEKATIEPMNPADWWRKPVTPFETTEKYEAIQKVYDDAMRQSDESEAILVPVCPLCAGNLVLSAGSNWVCPTCTFEISKGYLERFPLPTARAQNRKQTAVMQTSMEKQLKAQWQASLTWALNDWTLEHFEELSLYVHESMSETYRVSDILRQLVMNPQGLRKLLRDRKQARLDEAEKVSGSRAINFEG